MDYIPYVYSVYAAVSLILTVFLARTLSSSGRVFLAKAWSDDPAFGDALNRLLVVGFYLMNLGWASTQLAGGIAPTPREAFEVLSSKLGALLLTLAVMHFANLWIFNAIRRRSMSPVLRVPVRPSGSLNTQES